MRFALWLTAILAGLIACLPLHYLWRLFGQPSPWPRCFLAWVAQCAGMRVRIVGRPIAREVLFVANHISWLDILVLAGSTGTAFVSKAEVARWPAIGWLAGLNNTVFVARTERRAVQGQAGALRAALEKGQPMALFPEGTTEGGAEVLPFRASLLASLFPPPPGIKVQPVAIDYGPATEDLAWVGDEKAWDNARRILSRPGATQVTLRFLDPLDPAEAGDRKALAEKSRAAIVEALRASAATRDRL